AGGEDDLERIALEHRGEPLPGLLERRAGRLAVPVHRRRVARARRGRGEGGSGGGSHRRASGVIEIDGHGVNRVGRVSATGVLESAPAVVADPLRDLGVRTSADGGRLRVYSPNATRMELCLFDERDPRWVE